MSVPEQRWDSGMPYEPTDDERDILRAHGGEWPDREDVGPWDRREEKEGQW